MTQMEPVDIIATFNQKGLLPRVMKWGQKQYKIASVNLVHTIKDGAVRIYFFSVSDGVNSWKLGFNTENLRWWVEDHFAQ